MKGRNNTSYMETLQEREQKKKEEGIHVHLFYEISITLKPNLGTWMSEVFAPFPN